MWRQPIALTIIVLAVSIAGTIAFGAYRWQIGTKALRSHLEAARLPIKPMFYDAREIAGLPDPVQRYFRRVLKDGQPLIAAARFSHEGSFNMSETSQKWSACTSTQLAIAQRPGFDWDGRIAMIPIGAAALPILPMNLPDNCTVYFFLANTQIPDFFKKSGS